MSNGCIYVNAVVVWRGWGRRGASLFSDWPPQRPGGDAVIQNCKPAQAEGASHSVSGGDRGEKGEVKPKIVREVKRREKINNERQS